MLLKNIICLEVYSRVMSIFCIRIHLTKLFCRTANVQCGKHDLSGNSNRTNHGGYSVSASPLRICHACYLLGFVTTVVSSKPFSTLYTLLIGLTHWYKASCTSSLRWRFTRPTSRGITRHIPLAAFPPCGVHPASGPIRIC